jgi:hypothetical protein
MELVLIDWESPEWEFMWNWLENHPLNQGLDSPSLASNNGEHWQYMGSLKQKDRILHQFRHRNHPVTNNIQTVSVQSSDLFTPDQIIRTYNI